MHVQEECTAIKVPFPGWKQHSSAGSSGSAHLRAAAPPGTRWHGWLVLSVKVHVPGHRGLSHPSHVTSLRLQNVRLTCHAHGCVSYKCSLRGCYKDQDVGLFSFILEQISWRFNSCTATKGHLLDWSSLYQRFLLQDSLIAICPPPLLKA